MASSFESQEKQSKDEGPERPQQNYACLRVLVLHDAQSNAKESHLLLKDLDDRLYEKHGIELVYINSPLVVVGDEMGQDRRRVWWEDNAEESHPYLGLDASLLHIQQIWKSNTLSGILAIGQGASIASLLPMMHPQLEFGVFIFGKTLMEEDEQLMANWPCLHLVRGMYWNSPFSLVPEAPSSFF